MSSPLYSRWLKFSLISLSVVAALGVTLRYKIAFSLPFIDQGNLLHGHSHFAFSGWVSQALMTLLISYLNSKRDENLFKKYGWILLTNLLISYAMLISFSIQGYAFFSILFSTLSIFVSFIFSVLFWKDLNKLNIIENAHLWFKASLFFNIISCLGPFYLGFMMGNHAINHKLYMLSIYYFLHFQYNGWFLFACIGLIVSLFHKLVDQEKAFNYIFWIFSLSCVPCYFLSALWLSIPKGIYLLVVFSAFMQFVAWLWFIKIVVRNIHILKKELSKQAKWLMTFSGIAMTIKLMLQLGSTYPPLSQIAFGFRPIVIGYIHLVLLGVISMFILAYVISEKIFIINRTLTIGVMIFVSGVILNEILLMTQGIFAMATISIDYINILLLIAAIVMFTGTLLINIKLCSSSQIKN